jgi:ferrous iron transport protein A
MKKLSLLKVGEAGIIDSFVKDDISVKLMEMGCVPGERISVEQIAPLGDPISISIAGYILSLRLDEAEGILVKPEFQQYKTN